MGNAIYWHWPMTFEIPASNHSFLFPLYRTATQRHAEMLCVSTFAIGQKFRVFERELAYSSKQSRAVFSAQTWPHAHIGLFCKRALWKRLYCAKETYTRLHNIVSFIGLFCKKDPETEQRCFQRTNMATRIHSHQHTHARTHTHTHENTDAQTRSYTHTLSLSRTRT